MIELQHIARYRYRNHQPVLLACYYSDFHDKKTLTTKMNFSGSPMMARLAPSQWKPRATSTKITMVTTATTASVMTVVGGCKGVLVGSGVAQRSPFDVASAEAATIYYS